MFVLSIQHVQLSKSAKQHRTSKPCDILGIKYVTERILVSVLPSRDTKGERTSLKEDAPKDIYEEQLISMLNQKHGEVRTT